MNQHLLGVIKVFFFFLVFASCDSSSYQNQEVKYFENRFIFFQNLDDIQDSLENQNIYMEYNDSFSGIEQGIKSYSFQEQKDSMIFLTNLFFEEDKLNGLIIEVSSKKITDSKSFLEKARQEVSKNIFSSEIVVDTATVDVNPLESSTGKLFRLKIYSRRLYNKILLNNNMKN